MNNVIISGLDAVTYVVQSKAEKHMPYEDYLVDCVSNVLAHAQKPDFVFRRNERVQLNRRGRQFSRLPAAELCASAVVTLNTPCSAVV